MARNVAKLVAGCAAVLIVIFAVACGTQQKQEGTAPGTETTQAPSTEQAAPPEGSAPPEGMAPSDPAAPAEDQPQQNQ
jgi:hypothetical protein